MSLAEALDAETETLTVEPIRVRGRASRMPTVLGKRALSPLEVAAQATREVGYKPSPLQRLSSRHKKLARLVAQGMPDGVAAHVVGLTASRVSILKGDPTFQELVALSAKELAITYSDFHEKMAGLGEDTVDLLQERLENDPDQFDSDQLLRITTALADRTGHAPKREPAPGSVNFNFNFGDQLEEARRRAKSSLIEGRVTDLKEDSSQ